MRLTSIMWLGIFMRQETARGAFVTVAKKGAQQAGALFVIHNHLNGTLDLYGPAPQSLFDDNVSDRQFEKVLTGVSQSELDVYMEKQKNFDPDLWIIETESGTGNPSLELMH